MTRLNQSRRQKIGYTYSPQVYNDVSLQPIQRNQIAIQEQSFQQSGSGRVEMKNYGVIPQPNKMSNEAIKECVSKIDFTPRETLKKGEGLLPLPPQSGSGCCGKDSDLLPGDLLKKKLLQKMVRERRMKALGDRVKTTPIQHGFNGGSINIAGSSSGQSRSKDLGKGYKLNPKPLVGAGKQKGGFIIAGLAALIAGISAAASAASAVAIGGTTVGALAGTVLTGAAVSAGPLLAKKIIGGGKVKPLLLKAVKSVKIGLKDFSTPDKIKLKSAYDTYKKNPSKESIVAFGKKMAPIARNIMKKKLGKKLAVMKIGKKIKNLKGDGLNLSGEGVKTFDNAFVKHLVKSV